jgi:beta-phosphoglucomutase-like phosphatase (HAD superfamily)
MKNRYVNKKEAKKLISKFGEEYIVINNPHYIYPAKELYLLAPKIKKVKDLTAAVMDMDGTTTTTEPLCIHSLEYMVRQLSGRISMSQWDGLDAVKDYPFIIGNSTTRHVEFLIRKYKDTFNKDLTIKSFLYAAGWTIANGKDNKRKEEVVHNLNVLNYSSLINNESFINICKSPSDSINKELLDEFLIPEHRKLPEYDFNTLVRIGIDVYYQRYHEILERIKLGEGDVVAGELYGSTGKHLIETMPGIEVFLPLIKGLIKQDEDAFFDRLIDSYLHKAKKPFPRNKIPGARKSFSRLCAYFIKHPLRTAVVTSSIFYEADIVLKDVFKIIYSELDKIVSESPVKQDILQAFCSYRDYYDAVVTASDSSEIRLKPHRDLYSIALFKLNVPGEKFNEVVGFEDSESGTVAIRAAGIGLSVAVPFAETSGHNLKAAAYICRGGLPEVILKHKLFLMK